MNFKFLFYTSLFFLTQLATFVKGGNDFESDYDYNNILTKDPKISIDFHFDNKSFYSTAANAFDKYFNTLYETELPLYNGGKMACYIPKKISLPQNNPEVINNSLSSFKNISLDYGYIFLREISSICYSTYEDRWYYKLCPTKKAVQTLTFNKIDPKSGKEVKEVNYLGFGMNYTNLSSPEEIYMKETGVTIDHKILNNSKKNEPFVLIKDRLIKIYNNKYRFYLSEINNPKKAFYLQFVYEKGEISKFPKGKTDTEKYKKYYGIEHNKTHNIITRLIKKYINFNDYYIEDTIPTMINYSTFWFSTGNVITPIEEYSLKHFVDEDYLYCEDCDFLSCKSKGCHVFSYPSRQYSHVIDVVDQYLAKINNKLLFGSQTHFFWSGNKYMNFEGNYFFIYNNYLIGQESNFKLKVHNGDMIIFINKQYQKHKKILIIDESLPLNANNAYKKCTIQNVISNNMIKLSKDCNLSKFLYDQKRYFIVTGKSNWQKSFNRPKPFIPILKDEKNDDHDFKYNLIPSIDIYKEKENEEDITFYIGKKEEFQINMNLFSKTDKISNLHLYLSQNKTVTGNDYEMIINSKSGVLIKQIKNDTSFSFYTKQHSNFFISGTRLDFIFINSTIYLNSLDNDGKFSTKLKHILESPNYKLNYFHISRKKSSRINVYNLKFFNKIQPKKLIETFIFEKKYLLTENSTFVDYFEGGDYCEEQKKNRTVKIIYTCDPKGVSDLFISTVKEEKMCEYTYYVKSRLLCNPNVIMNNIIQSSDTNVNCVIKNDIYNHNEEEFFKPK